MSGVALCLVKFQFDFEPQQQFALEHLSKMFFNLDSNPLESLNPTYHLTKITKPRPNPIPEENLLSSDNSRDHT